MCANECPHGSARGALGNWRPYRDFLQNNLRCSVYLAADHSIYERRAERRLRVVMKAGVFLSAHGLRPSSKGRRVKCSDERRIVIEVESLEDAVEWVKRAPFDRETEVEIRPVLEAADFAR